MSAAWLGGCVTLQGTSASDAYSWYHPQGGEYLFTYDARQCEAATTALGQALSHDTNGPFFSCMYRRGYWLVGTDGELRNADVVTAPAQVPAQVPAGVDVTYQP